MVDTSSTIQTSHVFAFIDIYVTDFSIIAIKAGAEEAVDNINTTSIIAVDSNTFVYICLTETSSEAISTGTFKCIYPVYAGTIIQASHSNAVVNIYLTESSCESAGTDAGVVVELVDTRGIVHAGLAYTVVYHGRTELSSVAHLTETGKSVHHVHTQTIGAVHSNTVVNICSTE